MDISIRVWLASVVTQMEVPMIRKLFLLTIFSFVMHHLGAQETAMHEGTISYLSKNKVYIRFNDTKSMKIGDTLTVWQDEKWKKALVIESLSSQSCVSQAILTITFTIGDKIRTTLKEITATKKIIPDAKKPDLSVKETAVKKDSLTKPKQRIESRLSIATNGSRDKNARDFDRVRTTATLDIDNIRDSKFSLESYVNYTHKLGTPINDSTFQADFKIYSMALSYASENGIVLSMGRKMNNHLANMGAIDGLQIEKKFKKLTLGAFGGTRPDNQDYSFNSNLVQFGGYMAHEIVTSNGPIQTSIAFAEQKYFSATDRRFIYFQHSNAWLKKLQFFYSIECELFQNINQIKTNRFNLTSTYFSLRYKPSNKISFTTSYDNRKNIIYYETYRSYIEQLINQETRQGFRLQMNYRILPLINLSLSSFYRFQSNRPDPTKNYFANLSFSQIPKLKASFNMNFNYMNTYYFSGSILGTSITKDLFKGLVSTELSYRKVDYRFFNKDQGTLNQHIWGFSLNIYGKKRTSLMVSYEGTYEPNVQYGRYYLSLTKRFRSKKQPNP
ncbi:MAG: hypothetical protein K9I55_07175 [Haliscomenobacter sp.]|jgi:hypothetical protein|nr:hypothetical protein [Haliscomenobacter sp.]